MGRIVDKLKKKLSKWKRNMVSIVGRSMLVIRRCIIIVSLFYLAHSVMTMISI